LLRKGPLNKDHKEVIEQATRRNEGKEYSRQSKHDKCLEAVDYKEQKKKQKVNLTGGE
jgi:hypothetical protein